MHNIAALKKAVRALMAVVEEERTIFIECSTLPPHDPATITEPFEVSWLAECDEALRLGREALDD